MAAWRGIQEAGSPANDLLQAYLRVRSHTENLAAPLSPEDQQLQAMPDASPVKWHRAHTTWFFETFVLIPLGFAPYNADWGVLFNSYYEALGPRHHRPLRGLLSRPQAQEVTLWRRHVDEAMCGLLEGPLCDAPQWQAIVQLGLAHEQQHQELLLTDILAAFAQNPLQPAYCPAPPAKGTPAMALTWTEHPGGVLEVGADDNVSFAFDNERPRHRQWLQPFALANRLITVGEWVAFSADGGYQTPSLWLSEGLDWVRSGGALGPAYTRRQGNEVTVFGLAGTRVANHDEPILHLSFFEAEAMAAWMGARLPTEAEWETLAATTAAPTASNEQMPTGVPEPAATTDLCALYDSAWQWTRSSYAPYPGFRPAAGAIGEYNGKFMVNQQVLKGGSLFTPLGHSRPTYRNFWHPHTQFQATGVRLARDV